MTLETPPKEIADVLRKLADRIEDGTVTRVRVASQHEIVEGAPTDGAWVEDEDTGHRYLTISYWVKP